MGQSVRAKFTCQSVTQYAGPSRQYTFAAATGGEENKSWAKYTPSGALSMTVDNPEVTFEPGKSYFLDFSPA